ncbi:g9786 [Coccomyxa viridis]|uniref:G9786 protein n=1 Tax=Coccomyxa viridis TaxID=1274662 RepID=A0ABP1G3N0_9CHLO
MKQPGDMPETEDLDDVMSRLEESRRYTDLRLGIMSALTDARDAQYSFLRAERLQQCSYIILGCLACEDRARSLQHAIEHLTDQALDMLLGVLQQHMNHRTDIKPILALERGVTEDEHSAALKLLEIMCLVSERTREVAHERNACAVLLAKLEADVEEGTLAGACLDTLLALLADSPLNQQDFLAEDGLARVCQVLLRQHSPSCQILCCKALNLLVTHILPGSTSTAAEVLEEHMGGASAKLLSSPVPFEEYPRREDMETCLQKVAISALAKLPA